MSQAQSRTISASPSFGLRVKVAVKDVFASFKHFEVAFALALSNFNRAYRFLSLGRIWRSLNTLIFVLILGIFYSTILDRDLSYYLPYLATGYVIWNFLSGFVMEGLNVFIKGSKIFSSYDTPLNTFVLSLSVKLLIQLCVDLIPVMLIYIAFGNMPSWTWLYFPLGLLIIYVAGYGTAFILGILNALVRDLSQMVPSILRVGFFVTPVIWSVEMAAKRAALVTYNPLYYFIEIARTPLLGGVPDPIAYMVTIPIAFGLLIVGFGFFAYGRRSVYYVL